jgi:hypothetical protein
LLAFFDVVAPETILDYHHSLLAKGPNIEYAVFVQAVCVYPEDNAAGGREVPERAIALQAALAESDNREDGLLAAMALAVLGRFVVKESLAIARRLLAHQDHDIHGLTIQTLMTMVGEGLTNMDELKHSLGGVALLQLERHHASVPDLD